MAEDLGRCTTTGKLSFRDRAAARRLAKHHPDHMSEYRCEYCQLFHIGHTAPAIIRGKTTRTDRYRPVHHARPDDMTPELDTLEHLQAARKLIATGARHIRGTTRADAIARIDAEIMRVADLLLAA